MDNEKDPTTTSEEAEDQARESAASQGDPSTGRVTSEESEVAAKIKPAKNEPIKLEIFRSGHFNEADAVVIARNGTPYLMQGRAVSQEYCQELVTNTKKLMARANMNIPVLRGHPELEGDRPEQEQAVEGWVEDLEIRPLKEKDQYGDPEVSVVATVMLTGELKKDYDEGKLPKRSPVWNEAGGKLPDGRRVGMHFINVGFLGRDQPAMPSLSNLAVASQRRLREAASVRDLGALDKLQDAISNIGTQIKTALTALASKHTAKGGTECAQMETGMTPEEAVEKLMNIQEFLSGAQSALQECIEEYGKGAEEDPGAEVVEVEGEIADDMTEGKSKAEAGAEEEKEAIEEEEAKKMASRKPQTATEIKVAQALKAQQRKYEAELASARKLAAEADFASLLRDEKILPGKKDAFLEVASTQGVDKARAYFASETKVQTPPVGRALESDHSTKATSAEEIKNELLEMASQGYAQTLVFAKKADKLVKLATSDAEKAEFEQFAQEIKSPPMRISSIEVEKAS